MLTAGAEGANTWPRSSLPWPMVMLRKNLHGVRGLGIGLRPGGANHWLRSSLPCPTVVLRRNLIGMFQEFLLTSDGLGEGLEGGWLTNAKGEAEGKPLAPLCPGPWS